jgi:AraC-like DNA-binding protein
MERAADVETFLAAPVGRYVHAGVNLAWCAAKDLAGSAVWGAPSANDVSTTVSLFQGFLGRESGAPLDIVLDARRVERVTPDALDRLMPWLVEQRDLLKRRVRLQIGIIPEGLLGVTLTGILPTLGEMHPFRVVKTTQDALTQLGRSDAQDLAREIDEVIAASRAVPAWLDRLRALLKEERGHLSLDEAAKRLALSTRTAQRLLQEQGTSFSDEAREARFVVAHDRLLTTDDKVVVVAAAVGLSEGALTQLIRERTGSTPSELRKQRELRKPGRLRS